MVDGTCNGIKRENAQRLMRRRDDDDGTVEKKRSRWVGHQQVASWPAATDCYRHGASLAPMSSCESERMIAFHRTSCAVVRRFVHRCAVRMLALHVQPGWQTDVPVCTRSTSPTVHRTKWRQQGPSSMTQCSVSLSETERMAGFCAKVAVLAGCYSLQGAHQTRPSSVLTIGRRWSRLCLCNGPT